MQYNNQAKEMFSKIDISGVKADDRYPIFERTDNSGRKYYGVSHFWGMDDNISADTELSWLEWDGNEVNVSFSDPNQLNEKYIESVGILKGWKEQLKKYSDSKFSIIMSYDNGDLQDEETEYSFTLRFWKERSETEVISSINDFAQPVIIEYCN